MFDAIANGKINIDNHQWHIHLHDVEVLNKSAFDGKYDVTKLSFNAYSRECARPWLWAIDHLWISYGHL
jgi:predicted solute-binding protein